MYCVKFKDVFPFIKNGANIKQDANAGGIPVTRIETLAGGEFNTSRLGYANIFDITPYYEYVLNSGDILMSHINSPEYLGRAVVFEDKYDIVIHGMNLLRLKANKEFIDSRYAVYLFNGNTFKEHIRKITKKSVNQASFSINDLKEIELQLPSIENQVIVAEKLDKLKMLIKKKNRLIVFLDEMIKSRFVELFGDIDCNTKNWPIETLENLAELITDGEHSTPKRCNEGIYLLSARNILNHSLKLDDVDYIDETEYSRISKRVIPKAGDILLSCSGSVGRCCMVPMEIKFQLVRSVALIRFKSEITPIFAEYMITSDWFQRQINSLKTASSQANLFQGRIKKLKGFVPDINLQYEFIKIVNQINKLKSDVQKSIDETQLLMDSLMQEYFG